MKNVLVALSLATALTSASAFAFEGQVSVGHFGRLDHVFLIVMENQTNTDILGNANAPFINAYASVANQATNYFAVGHPSAPNYLEMMSGSNFGLPNDFWPNWTNGRCAGFYDHYSLLRTLAAGFGLPCLNHACDPTSVVMDKMFAFGHEQID